MDREIWRGKDVGYIVKKKMNAAVGKMVWFLSIDGDSEA